MTAAGPRRQPPLLARILLLLAGIFAIAVAVAVMLWTSFGPGPLDVFVSGLTRATGVPLTVGYWVALAMMLGVARLLGRSPGLGTVIAPLVIGPTVQTMLVLLEAVDAPSSFGARTVVHLLAIGLAGVGAGALVASGLGAGTGELLAAAASGKTGRPEPQVRLAFEAAWLVIGIALGGAVGVGTVLVAGLIGPSVVVGHRIVCLLVDSPRHRVGVARAAARMVAEAAPELVPTS